ncbi:MAG: GTP 3',8-cyclase MoaA [Myxococcales bacterium]|nr:GTP 3',8-cyclase MoaA [Myxococcales bacterium]
MASADHSPGSPRDRLGRPLRELRISVTDRCNFRCGYCMPADVFHEGYRFAPREDILSFEEITRLTGLCAQRFGLRKLRLTGGEPLTRRHLPRLIEMLAAVAGDAELALTTNGALLAVQAEALKRAGLTRVTVSLDAVDDDTFRRCSGGRGELRPVLAGIEAAAAAGLAPLKVNCVVQRGLNEHAVEGLAQHFRGSGVIVRFIEFMDVGTLNRWQAGAVIEAAEIRRRLSTVAGLEPLPPQHRGEVAERFAFRDGSLEVGIIASVSQPFCRDCSRARLSADGRLLHCLFAQDGLDLRTPLRAGASDAELLSLMTESWQAREDRYSELRAEVGEGGRRRLEMYQVGG